MWGLHKTVVWGALEIQVLLLAKEGRVTQSLYAPRQGMEEHLPMVVEGHNPMGLRGETRVAMLAAIPAMEASKVAAAADMQTQAAAMGVKEDSEAAAEAMTLHAFARLCLEALWKPQRPCVPLHDGVLRPQ